MAKILLVEPDYKNKYPPIGLMKIATFHRQMGDIVEFYKGEAPYTKVSQADRVYITSLFTFYYDITVKCIQHYQKYIHSDHIFLGGIAATLLTKDFETDTKMKNIVRGQLTDSRLLGFKKKINIDCLALDYDILDDISYIYPAGDNYFIYTTRGCKRGCRFCAVQELEPDFTTTNNVIQQVKQVDEIYGTKRNMLIMDNNTLFSDELRLIVNNIVYLGFTGTKNYISPNPFVIMMNKIRRRKKNHVNYEKQIEATVNYLNSFSTRLKNKEKVYSRYIELLEYINKNDTIWYALKKNENELTTIIEKYRSKSKVIRYVDFNQGIDSRLLNNENCALLARLPISPFRLAYDNAKETKKFINATKLAVKNGILDFSNYMLYNFDDRPTELWTRLFNAITLYNKSKHKINAFSFPMKYAPIDKKDRSYIGKYWNKKYLSAIGVILNVTKGVVVKEFDFFYEAYGENKKEYMKILTMPDEFIRFRHFFRDNSLLALWHDLYDALTTNEKKRLLKILCDIKTDKKLLSRPYSKNINKILCLYAINKSQIDRGAITVASIIQRLNLATIKSTKYHENITSLNYQNRY